MQKFYGGNITEWFHVSMSILRIYLEMLPVLQAEEQLSQINLIAIGTGAMDPEDSREIIRELYKQLGQDNKPTFEQVRAQMIAAGIEYIEVKNE